MALKETEVAVDKGCCYYLCRCFYSDKEPAKDIAEIMTEKNGKNITAINNEKNNEQRITIQNNNGRLSEDDINKMILDADKYSENDKKIKENIETANKVKSYINKIKMTVEDDNFVTKMGDKIQQKILRKLLDSLEIINNTEITTDDYEKILNKLEEYISPKLEKYKISNIIVEESTSSVVNGVHVSIGNNKK
jgi:molecular chaperone DnaK (HSP70)